MALKSVHFATTLPNVRSNPTRRAKPKAATMTHEASTTPMPQAPETPRVEASASAVSAAEQGAPDAAGLERAANSAVSAVSKPPLPRTPSRAALWAVRVAFLVVFLINIQCAFSFILAPESFLGAYQLQGVAGTVAIQGIGVAFLMWNCTYPAFIAAPTRFPALGWVILAQQVVGLLGESLIRASLPALDYELLAASIERLILFDGAGLILMGITWLWLHHSCRPSR